MQDNSILERNLASGRAALQHVRHSMPKGSWNQFADLFSSGGTSFIAWLAAMNVLRDSGDWSVENVAATAEAVGAGNCGFQSASAYVFLSRHMGVRPLDMMGRTRTDHAFVVIGRRRGSLARDVRTWGPDAVLVDPWVDDCYPAELAPLRCPALLRDRIFAWIGDVDITFRPEVHERLE